MSKQVLLLHGWLGGPRTFGSLDSHLISDGHRVLPLFRRYETRPRQKTLHQLADELENALSGENGKTGPPQPIVIVAHSMGALLARVWMLRHYFERGRRPPVERVIECGAPRHGVHLASFARIAIRLGLVPGTALARQMTAPSPFLWDLAEAELRHAKEWPQTLSLTGLSDPRTANSRLIGGEESDEVVPALFAQPHPVFLRPGQPPQRVSRRIFLVVNGYRHSGRLGILSHIRTASHGQQEKLSPVAMALRALVATGALPEKLGLPLVPVRRSMLVVRFNPKSAHFRDLSLLLLHREKEAIRPVSEHREGLALFLFHGCTPKSAESFQFSLQSSTAQWHSHEVGLRAGMEAGEVAYVDLRNHELIQ